MTKKIIVFLVLALFFFVFIILDLADPPRKLILKDETFVVAIADSEEAIVRGLSGRTYLANNEGMLFVYDDKRVRHFWMRDMNFPIDIIWIEDDRIVGWEENVPVPQFEPVPEYSSLVPVNKVLEITAGTVTKLDIKKGDKINI